MNSLMLFILASAISMACIRQTLEFNKSVYTFINSRMISGWIHIILSYTLSSFGLVFGLANFVKWYFSPARLNKTHVSFGVWLWSVIGIYILLILCSSVVWAMVELYFAKVRNPGYPYHKSYPYRALHESLLSLGSVCSNWFAWFLISIWISFRFLNPARPQISHSDETDQIISDRHDFSIAVYSALAFLYTIFFNLARSIGY